MQWSPDSEPDWSQHSNYLRLYSVQTAAERWRRQSRAANPSFQFSLAILRCFTQIFDQWGMTPADRADAPTANNSCWPSILCRQSWTEQIVSEILRLADVLRNFPGFSGWHFSFPNTLRCHSTQERNIFFRVSSQLKQNVLPLLCTAAPRCCGLGAAGCQ